MGGQIAVPKEALGAIHEVAKFLVPKSIVKALEILCLVQLPELGDVGQLQFNPLSFEGNCGFWYYQMCRK